jgi:hypothetical protein
MTVFWDTAQRPRRLSSSGRNYLFSTQENSYACYLIVLCKVIRSSVDLNTIHVYRCQLPYEYDNATYNLPEINMTIPWDSKSKGWSSCARLDVNFTTEYLNAGIPANKSMNCDKWVYDTTVYKSSAVTEVRIHLS